MSISSAFKRNCIDIDTQEWDIHVEIAIVSI